jgi:uncharacterized protein YpuA (DUF1002 family)
MSVTTVIVLLIVLVPGAVYAVSAYRRRVHEEGVVTGDVAEDQRRYLAANWSAVEQAAARSGMEPEQIAEVRRKLLGA